MSTLLAFSFVLPQHVGMQGLDDHHDHNVGIVVVIRSIDKIPMQEAMLESPHGVGHECLISQCWNVESM